MASEMTKVALLLGGSGETGKQVLKQLNMNPLVSRIILVGRRLLEVDDQPKVDQKVVDFDQIEDHKIAFDGADFAICCLGTTRGKAGKDGFVKVDYEYVVNSAKILKEGGTCQEFHLVSSWGAKHDAWALYPQTKGKTEEAIKAMGFSRTSIYRPGLLMTSRDETRIFEKIARGFAGYFDKSSKYSIATEVLGKVIVYNATVRKIEDKTEVLEHPDLLRIAQEAEK